MRGSSQMKALRDLEARLKREIEALQNQLLGVQQAIKALGGETTPDDVAPGAAVPPRRKPPSPIKDAVLGLLADHKEAGLTVGEVIEMSEARGRSLDRASVSSLLSRLKRENVLTSDQSGKYRIIPPAPAPEPGMGPKLNLVG